MILKSVTVLCKTISSYWYTSIQLIKEYKSIVNSLIKTISDETLYKLYLTKILKKIYFDHLIIISKLDTKAYTMLFVNN